MIHSTYRDKPGAEDRKTSSVFGLILMLPDDVVWSLIRKSCSDNGNLPEVAGNILSYDFWPSWDSTGTKNKTRVEPDLFIRFQTFDLIIEAKKDDESEKLQYDDQWKKELISYQNEYGTEREVCFIAIGGNSTMKSESVELKDGQRFIVNKCTWLSLLIQAAKLQKSYEACISDDMHRSALIRALKIIKLGFNINHVYYIEWMDSLDKINVNIDSDAAQFFLNLEPLKK